MIELDAIGISPTQVRLHLASRLLQVPREHLVVDEVPDIDATYFCNPARGGDSIVIADGPEVLFGMSAVPPLLLIEEFRNGRRTPLDAFGGVRGA